MYKNPDMKKILVIAFIVSNSISFAQTKLDSMLFDRVNQYRVSNGLHKIIWDTRMYKVADNQSKYMYLTGSVTHNQDTIYYQEGDTFVIEKDFVSRFSKHLDRNNDTLIYGAGENLLMLGYLINAPIEQTVECMLELWITSPSHNALLLDYTMVYGSISSKNYDLPPLPSDLDYLVRETYVAFDLLDSGVSKNFYTTYVSLPYSKTHTK